MSQFQQPRVQTPGLNRSQGPGVPRVQQLVGTILGEARAGMSADRTRAAAFEQTARGEVQAVQAMDAARRQTANVYNRAEQNIAQHQERKRIERTQINAMNMLMSENADNPEWLAKQAASQFRNARTADEKRIWSGVLKQANRKREEKGLTEERHKQRARKANWELANQTSRVQVQQFAGQLRSDPELRQQIIADGSDIHDRLLEHVIGQLGESVPQLQDIRKSDPDYEFKKQLRDDLVLSISQQIAPLGNQLIKEYSQEQDEAALTDLQHSISAASETILPNTENFDAATTVEEWANGFEEAIATSGAPLGEADRRQLLQNYILDSVEQLGSTDDNVNLGRGAEVVDKMVERFPNHERAIRTTFQQTMEKNMSRHVQTEIQNVMQKVRNTHPNATRHEMTRAVLQHDDYGNLHAQLRNEVGIPFEMEGEMEPWQASMAAAIDQQILRHEQHLQQQFGAIDRDRQSFMNAASGEPVGDSTALHKYSLSKSLSSVEPIHDDETTAAMQALADRGWRPVATKAAAAGDADLIESGGPDVREFHRQRRSVQQMMADAGVIGPGQGIPEQLSKQQRDGMDPTLLEQYDQLITDAAVIDGLMYSSVHQTTEIPSQFTKELSKGMSLGQDEHWNRAATMLKVMPDHVQHEFLQKIAKDAPHNGRLLADHLQLTVYSGNDLSTEQLMRQFVGMSKQFDDDQLTLAEGLAERTGPILDDHGKVNQRQHGAIILSEMLNLSAHHREGTTGFFHGASRILDIPWRVFGAGKVEPGVEERIFTPDETENNLREIFGPEAYEDFMNAAALTYTSMGFNQHDNGMELAVAHTLSRMRERGYAVVQSVGGKPKFTYVGRDPHRAAWLQSAERAETMTESFRRGRPGDAVAVLRNAEERTSGAASGAAGLAALGGGVAGLLESHSPTSAVMRSVAAAGVAAAQGVPAVRAASEQTQRKIDEVSGVMQRVGERGFPVTNMQDMMAAMIWEQYPNRRDLVTTRVGEEGVWFRGDFFIDVNFNHPNFQEQADTGTYPLVAVFPDRDDPNGPPIRIPIPNFNYNPETTIGQLMERERQEEQRLEREGERFQRAATERGPRGTGITQGRQRQPGLEAGGRRVQR